MNGDELCHVRFAPRNAAKLLLLAALSVYGTVSGALSESASEPQFETALYGDWLLRCAPGTDGATPVRICEVAQDITVATGFPVQVAIGRVTSKGPLTITVRAPGTTFPSTVNVSSREGKLDLELPWVRCLPGGCFATQELRPDMLKAWREKSSAPKIVYKNGLGQLIDVQISKRGFGAALSALMKEP